MSAPSLYFKHWSYFYLGYVQLQTNFRNTTYILECDLHGMTGRSQPFTFFGGTAMTFSAAHPFSFKNKQLKLLSIHKYVGFENFTYIRLYVQNNQLKLLPHFQQPFNSLNFTHFLYVNHFPRSEKHFSKCITNIYHKTLKNYRPTSKYFPEHPDFITLIHDVIQDVTQQCELTTWRCNSATKLTWVLYFRF